MWLLVAEGGGGARPVRSLHGSVGSPETKASMTEVQLAQRREKGRGRPVGVTDWGAGKCGLARDAENRLQG